MTGSVHAAIGAAIGHRVRNKPLAFGLGVLSHFLGDITPHKDIGFIETPVLVSTLVLIGRKYGWDSPEMCGAIGGISPDFEHIPYEIRQDPRREGSIPEKLFPTHNGQVEHAEWPWNDTSGVAVQILLFLAGLFLAGLLSRDSQ